MSEGARERAFQLQAPCLLAVWDASAVCEVEAMFRLTMLLTLVDVLAAALVQ